MATRKQHLIDANAGRAWPLDDAATTADDAGRLLPSDLLVDAHLRWPRPLGRYAFLSTLSLTPQLITVVVETAATLDGPGQVIAAVAAPRKTAARGTPLAVNALAPGVGGWLTFGAGVVDAPDAAYRFASPHQALLQARSAVAYRPPPVTSLAKLYSAPLENVVTLQGIGRLTVTAEARTIEGIVRSALVFRLEERDAAATATANLNLLADFVGPCGGRPESGSCGDPQPVEAIASVSPDCDGVLTIAFTGCARIAQLADRCGVFVACDVGLEDVCRAPYLPNADGLLPGEYTPEIILPASEPAAGSEGDVPIEGTPPTLPYLECFDDFIAQNFVVKAGDFGFQHDDSPDNPCWISEGLSEGGGVPTGSYASDGDSSASVRNVSVWDGGDVTTLYRRCTVALKLLAGPTGARHNAGVVINLHDHPTIAGRHSYWIAEIDADLFVFRLRRWTGTAWATLADATVPGLQVGDWYDVAVDVVPDMTSGQATVTLSLLGVDDPTVAAVIGPVAIANYYPSTGLFGVGADRAWSLFSWFEVEEIA